MDEVIGITEVCYGCGRRQVLSQPHKPNILVAAPGAFPSRNHKDFLPLCAKCAIHIKKPIVLFRDLEKQLGHKSHIRNSAKERGIILLAANPFWQEFLRYAQRNS